MTYLAHAGELDNVPPITVESVFSAWSFDPLAIGSLVVVGLVYGYGVVTLRRRGDGWSGWRVFSFCVLGLGTILIATCSSLATYDTTLLSMHMVQHMLLSMLAPIFLALGAPVTLALRTLPQRPRRWLLAVLHSTVAAVLAFPAVAFVAFVASPWVLYFSPLYEATLRSGLLHDLLHVHFLVIGCLFFWPLLGLDPVPGRVAYPFRMLTVFATLPFHAFLGVTIMAMDEVIAGSWYFGLDRSGLPSALSDQNTAGGILWGAGDLVALVIFGVLFAQWVRQSMREAEREDRRLDRADAEAARRAVTS